MVCFNTICDCYYWPLTLTEVISDIDLNWWPCGELRSPALYIGIVLGVCSNSNHHSLEVTQIFSHISLCFTCWAVSQKTVSVSATIFLSSNMFPYICVYVCVCLCVFTSACVYSHVGVMGPQGPALCVWISVTLIPLLCSGMSCSCLHSWSLHHVSHLALTHSPCSYLFTCTHTDWHSLDSKFPVKWNSLQPYLHILDGSWNGSKFKKQIQSLVTTAVLFLYLVLLNITAIVYHHFNISIPLQLFYVCAFTGHSRKY